MTDADTAPAKEEPVSLKEEPAAAEAATVKAEPAAEAKEEAAGEHADDAGEGEEGEGEEEEDDEAAPADDAPSTSAPAASTPIKLGFKTFNNGKECADYFRSLLSSSALDTDMNEYEYRVLLDLLQKGHPSAATKVGCGLRAFQVRHYEADKDARDREARAIFAVRKDGTAEDFSYIKCVMALFPGELTVSTNKRRREGGGGGGGRGRRGGASPGRGGGGARGGRGGRGGRGRGRGRGGHGGRRG